MHICTGQLRLVSGCYIGPLQPNITSCDMTSCQLWVQPPDARMTLLLKHSAFVNRSQKAYCALRVTFTFQLLIIARVITKRILFTTLEVLPWYTQSF